jgi:hypothetical protein
VILSPRPPPAVAYFFGIVFATVAGFVVWHGTRANQARLAIGSRRAQIKSLWRDVRGFGLRGVVILIALILLLGVARKL